MKVLCSLVPRDSPSPSASRAKSSCECPQTKHVKSLQKSLTKEMDLAIPCMWPNSVLWSCYIPGQDAPGCIAPQHHAGLVCMHPPAVHLLASQPAAAIYQIAILAAGRSRSTAKKARCHREETAQRDLDPRSVSDWHSSLFCSMGDLMWILCVPAGHKVPSRCACPPAVCNV